MLDRQKLESILTRRFAGASPQQVAAAANAIMGLDDEWEELTSEEEIQAYQIKFPGASRVAGDLAPDSEFRLLRRRGLRAKARLWTRSPR